jgi:hypothetical protein
MDWITIEGRVSRRHSAQDIAGTTRAAYLATEVSVRVPGSGAA